jgi:hypothetical protein
LACLFPFYRAVSLAWDQKAYSNVQLERLIVVNKWHAMFVWTKHSKMTIPGVLYV